MKSPSPISLVAALALLLVLGGSQQSRAQTSDANAPQAQQGRVRKLSLEWRDEDGARAWRCYVTLNNGPRGTGEGREYFLELENNSRQTDPKTSRAEETRIKDCYRSLLKSVALGCRVELLLGPDGAINGVLLLKQGSAAVAEKTNGLNLLAIGRADTNTYALRTDAGTYHILMQQSEDPDIDERYSDPALSWNAIQLLEMAFEELQDTASRIDITTWDGTPKPDVPIVTGLSLSVTYAGR